MRINQYFKQNSILNLILLILRRYDAASSLVGGDWVVTAGQDDSDEAFSSVLLYQSNTWQEYVRLPSGVFWHCQVTVGEDVFVIGGENLDSEALSTVYKLSDGMWSVFSSIKTPRSKPMCSVMGGKVFVIGGKDEYYNDIRSVEVLAPASNAWVDGPSLPEDVSPSHSVVFKDSLYVFDFGKVYRLDDGADQWITVKVGFFSSTRYVFPAPLLYDHQLHCVE